MILQVGELDHSSDPPMLSRCVRDPMNVRAVRPSPSPLPGEQLQRGEFLGTQAASAQLSFIHRSELEQLVKQRCVPSPRRDAVRHPLDV
jgi:hypothetical protein